MSSAAPTVRPSSPAAPTSKCPRGGTARGLSSVDLGIRGLSIRTIVLIFCLIFIKLDDRPAVGHIIISLLISNCLKYQYLN